MSRASRAATGPRTILHVDLDAFFAAVEQRDNPELRGKPVVVGGRSANDRGVVATASYEARKFGIHSAMPLRTAGRLCPDAIFVPGHHSRYQEVSRQVLEILRRFTPQVEAISIDEAWLDVTRSRALFGDGESIARQIKAAVRDETELTISVGVATTKLVAKIASDLRKPDGLVVVPPGDEAKFLDPLPISRLWGVGPKTAARLVDYGVRTIGDLQRLERQHLIRRLGPHGSTLVDRAHGIDGDTVDFGDAAKSIGHETTFEHDSADPEVIERTLLAMADGVSARLRVAGYKASTVEVKIRDSQFNTVIRQRTLPEPTDLTDPIWKVAVELGRPLYRGKTVRLVGVTASNLDQGQQLALFEADDPKQRAVVKAADSVRRRWGERAVTRARLIGTRTPAPFERDFGTSAEARGEHAADVVRGRIKPLPPNLAAAKDAEDAAARAEEPEVDLPPPDEP